MAKRRKPFSPKTEAGFRKDISRLVREYPRQFAKINLEEMSLADLKKLHRTMLKSLPKAARLPRPKNWKKRRPRVDAMSRRLPGSYGTGKGR